MLMTEPILVLMTIYLSFIYGLLYLCFFAYPISFQQERGWDGGAGQLPFLGILVGVIFSCIFVAVETKTRFVRKLRENGGRIVPENRLPPMIVGSIALPIGLFWFAWTSNPTVSWVPQAVSGIFIGFGILTIFLQAINYMIDVYLQHANSALAANAFVRSLFAAGFPLFASQMYHRLGTSWTTSLLGFISLALIPVPILFYYYGHHVRKWSRHSAAI